MPEKGYKNARESVSSQYYAAVHYWLKKFYGVATRCENKRCIGKSTNFQWAKKTDKPYDFKRSNFKRLCRSCHSKQDITPQMRQRMREVNPRTQRSHCLRGHPLSPGNIYIYRGSQRNCIKCIRLRDKQFKARTRASRLSLIKDTKPQK